MVKCKNCGILEELGKENYKCHAFEKSLTQEDIERERHCHMFIETVVEKGSALSPACHVILKKGEIEDKK